MTQHSKSHASSQTQAPTPVEIQKALGGVDYPASRESLVDTARHHHADKAIVELLGRLPSHRYESPADVSKDIARLR
ncbi:MAG TPA: DUF2795 domain-containing protein [Paraburkholderia sp.]|jgi:hypothetical protein|nr:DUF2795 domain-containing protein [Paraburkholderia sp.]